MGGRRNGFRLTQTVAGILALGFGGSGESRAAFIDFNNVGELAANFSLNHQGAGVRYAETESGGIGNSRAVESLPFVNGFQSHTTAVHHRESFRLSVPGDRVELSQFFLRQNHTDLPVFWSVLSLGILTDPTGLLGSNLAPNSYAHLRVFSDPNLPTRVSIEAEVKEASSPRLPTGTGLVADLIAGRWYKFSATFEHVSPTSILIGGLLEDWGLTGVSPLSTVFELPPMVVPIAPGDNVLGDSEVWGGFLGHREGGVALYDNFSVVPEPASLLFLGVGTAMVLMRGRDCRRPITVNGDRWGRGR